jgi:hypothetical protein
MTDQDDINTPLSGEPEGLAGTRGDRRGGASAEISAAAADPTGSLAAELAISGVGAGVPAGGVGASVSAAFDATASEDAMEALREAYEASVLYFQRMERERAEADRVGEATQRRFHLALQRLQQERARSSGGAATRAEPERSTEGREGPAMAATSVLAARGGAEAAAINMAAPPSCSAVAKAVAALRLAPPDDSANEHYDVSVAVAQHAAVDADDDAGVAHVAALIASRSLLPNKRLDADMWLLAVGKERAGEQLGRGTSSRRCSRLTTAPHFSSFTPPRVPCASDSTRRTPNAPST